jgi:hypothetical protein
MNKWTLKKASLGTHFTVLVHKFYYIIYYPRNKELKIFQLYDGIGRKNHLIAAKKYQRRFFFGGGYKRNRK